jgi:hypothetical protein
VQLRRLLHAHCEQFHLLALEHLEMRRAPGGAFVLAKARVEVVIIE